MREKTNLRMTQKGMVSFMILAVIAVFLIGFVGYVSVKRLRTENSVAESTNNPSVLAANSEDSMDDLTGNELDDEVMELDKVDDNLDTGIQEVDSATKSDTQSNDAMMMEDKQMGEQETMTVSKTKKVKLFGIIPLDAQVTVEKDSTTGEETITDQPFYLKFLSFLFTE